MQPVSSLGVRFTPEEEARLARIATQEGVDPVELVKDAALRLLEDDTRFRAGSERASSRLTAANSSKKRKWTPASNECSSRDADPLDARCRGRPRAHQELPHRASSPVCTVHYDRVLRNDSVPEDLTTPRTTGTRRRNS